MKRTEQELINQLEENGANVISLKDLKMTAEKFDELYKKGSYITICIVKEMIDLGYTDYIVDFVNAMLDSENGKSCHLMLTTNAYDDDTREVYQVPEYVDYMRKVFEEAPFMLALLSDLYHHIWLIMMLCLDTMPKSPGEVNIPTPQVRKLGISVARAMRKDSRFKDTDINKFKKDLCGIFGKTIADVFY